MYSKSKSSQKDVYFSKYNICINHHKHREQHNNTAKIWNTQLKQGLFLQLWSTWTLVINLQILSLGNTWRDNIVSFDKDSWQRHNQNWARPTLVCQVCLAKHLSAHSTEVLSHAHHVSSGGNFKQHSDLFWLATRWYCAIIRPIWFQLYTFINVHSPQETETRMGLFVSKFHLTQIHGNWPYFCL